jgi:hypothetical protein
MNLTVEGGNRFVDKNGVPRAVVIEPRKELGIELGNELQHLGFDMIHVRRGTVLDPVVLRGSLLELFECLLDFCAVVRL